MQATDGSERAVDGPSRAIRPLDSGDGAIVFEFGALETAKQAIRRSEKTDVADDKAPQTFSAVRHDIRFINRNDRNRRIP